VKARLHLNEIERDPNLIWNTYIDLLSSGLGELDPEQRPAALIFQYESEVQNGGHLQYFENSKASQLEETIAALNGIGANCYSAILREAGDQFLNRLREPVASREEYVKVAIEAEFAEFDQRFHECSTTLVEYLQRLLGRKQSLFIEIADRTI
jgi:hypothetical protein